MVWVCGNVCKRLPQFWSKRREIHKKGREKPEEGSKLSSKSVNGLRQKVQKTGIFLAVLALYEYLAHAQRAAQIQTTLALPRESRIAVVLRTRYTAPKLKVEQLQDSNQIKCERQNNVNMVNGQDG